MFSPSEIQLIMKGVLELPLPLNTPMAAPLTKLKGIPSETIRR